MTGAVVPPIHLSSTYLQSAPGEPVGDFVYARAGNPTRTALETCLAALEGTARAVAFPSGLAAVDALLRLLEPGDRVLVGTDGYGGTVGQLIRVHVPAGIGVDPVDLCDPLAVEAAVGTRTRLIWAESPTNPLLRVPDLAELARLAHAHGARLVVDNTFATPYLQQPVDLGADVVVHSTTKYLGGHSDLLGGALCADEETAAAVAGLQMSTGAVPSGFDAWLTLRGIRSLGARMDRHGASALRLAEALVGHPALAEVRHPGLPDHPDHDTARHQLSGPGGVVTLRLAAGGAAARGLVRRTRLFLLAESLGGVESLIGHPATMSHAATRGTPWEVDDDLVRLSVGLEDVDDLLEDVLQALG